MRPRVLVTNRIHADVADHLASFAELDLNPHVEPWPDAEIRRRAASCAAILAFMTDRVDAAFLDACPSLRLVACALKGFDNFDVAACTAAGVWVSIVPDLLTEPTAELAVGLAIGVARNIQDGHSLVRSGAFQGWRPTLYGAGLDGATVAIVGMGAVGQAITRRLAGFGCRIVGVDPAARSPAATDLPLRDALSVADFVILAAPLNPGTTRLFDAAVLATIKPGAFLVNVGRGSVVDEEAVAVALEAGRIAGYAADVFAFEDWALAGRPEAIPARLLAHPRTLFTPHLGSAVASVRRAIEMRAADNICDLIEGRAPRDAVNVLAAVPFGAKAALTSR